MKSNPKTLIWIIVILFITNISTIGTIIYNKRNHQKFQKTNHFEQINVPNNHLGRFFREELNLNYEQHQKFRNLRQNFHSNAIELTNKMQSKRNEIVCELGSEEADTAKLNQLANDIGELHKSLKYLTFNYYLDMKNICNTKQQQKLYEIFKLIVTNNGEINMNTKEINNRNNQ